MRTGQEITIYNSQHLNIQFDKEYRLFIQEWNHNDPMEMEVFKNELLQFKSVFEKYRPTSVLWLQEGFTSDIPQETHLWIEKNINEDCLSWGLKKCAFVVGKDVMAHLSVFNFFEETISCIAPKHFAGKQEAVNWILNGDAAKSIPIDVTDIEISFLGKTAEGKSQYSIETSTENTEATLKSFKHILKENAFLKENAARFYSLTEREKEVFKLYANGSVFKDIAETLFLSEFTVRTHWRNAKKKLAIKTHSDISDYKNSFLN
jgi:DNA-binding CsgD family transcriptional regulator